MASAVAEKIDKLLETLKQPSTIKAIGTLLGLVGYAIQPDKVIEILIAIQVFAAIVNGLYDANPRKSIPSEKKITPEDVSGMVRAEIASMIAAKKAKQ